MGYVSSAPFFRMSTETNGDMANASIGNCHCALPHPLDILSDTPALEDQSPGKEYNDKWTHTPPKLRVHALSQIDVYLDGFIYKYQGGPTERRQMLRHLFWSIVTVFRPNI